MARGAHPAQRGRAGGGEAGQAAGVHDAGEGAGVAVYRGGVPIGGSVQTAPAHPGLCEGPIRRGVDPSPRPPVAGRKQPVRPHDPDHLLPRGVLGPAAPGDRGQPLQGGPAGGGVHQRPGAGGGYWIPGCDHPRGIPRVHRQPVAAGRPRRPQRPRLHEHLRGPPVPPGPVLLRPPRVPAPRGGRAACGGPVESFVSAGALVVGVCGGGDGCGGGGVCFWAGGGGDPA
mmetsp:Transcript_36973/g.96808  ORF Transcript_36973/g.96808 Transcript_36973/m.96808 type:complete len:228 (-) Transcript_36973:993-1676(-)